MVERAHSPGDEDPERKEELRALARLLNDGSEPPEEPDEEQEALSEEPPALSDEERVEPDLEEESEPAGPFGEDETEPVAAAEEEAGEAPAAAAQEPVPEEQEPGLEVLDEIPAIETHEVKGLISGRFQTVGLLGGGPHGAVWRVRDHENQGRELALKILRQEWSHDPKLLIGLQAHLERCRGLTHETVNRLRAVGRTEDSRTWLAFDLVQGEDLRTILNRRGALPPRHAFEIARQILLGLEQGHALNLIHGDLRLEHVVLEDRVPWSDRNPFGVGVQLLDYGLRPLFEGTRPGRKGDLLAVGRILAELLTGARLGPDGPAWGGSEASPLTAGLTARARLVLDTALATDQTQRFETATDFRQAIEGTREWRAPRTSSWGWVAACVVFVSLSVVLGLEAYRKKQLDAPVYAAPPPGDKGVARSEFDKVRNELDELKRNGDAEIFRLEGEVEEARRKLEKEQADSAILLARAQDAEKARDELAEESAALKADREELASRLEASSGRVRELEAMTRPVPRIQDPLYLAAAYLERIVEQIDSGDAAGAHATLESFRSDETVRLADVGGADFLDGLVATALAWQRLAFETDDLARIPLTRKAQRALEETSGMRLAFDVDAADYLRLNDEAGNPINLGGRVDLVLDGLDRKIDTAAEELSARLDLRWKEIVADDFDREPSELVAIAGWFGDDRLEGYVERFVDDIKEKAEPNGVLNLAALQRFDQLPAWADAVESSPELEWLSNGGELLLFAYTRRFYDPSRTGEVLPPIDVRFRNGDGDVSGWREELAQRTALLHADSPFPGPVGARFLFHTRSPEGISSWLWETVQFDPDRPEGTDRSWIVEQEFFDQDGRARGERRVRVYLRGKRFYEKDVRSAEILDLSRYDASFQMRSWTPEPVPDPPDSLPVRPDQIAAFQDLLHAGEWRCLVNVQGTAMTWYSSELGLVRHADPSRITRELVYAELPR